MVLGCALVTPSRRALGAAGTNKSLQADMLRLGRLARWVAVVRAELLFERWHQNRTRSNFRVPSAPAPSPDRASGRAGSAAAGASLFG